MKVMTMNQFRIKDNSLTRKAEFSEISKITNKIADKTLEELEKDGIFIFPENLNAVDDLTRDQTILQSINDSFRSGNVMGFLGYGNERLVIDSRFCSESEDFFLQYLLEQVVEYPNVFDLETNFNLKNQIFNVLIFLFPRYLKNAMRKGLFKTYIRNDYNDSNPKGTIKIARHIKENMPFMGRVSYSQREYSYDNYLIELVRHTIEFIKVKSFGKTILERAKDEVEKIIEVTSNYRFHDRAKILTDNKKNIIRHAYFHEYRALQYLCILILQNQNQEIGTGINQVYGVLFDGAWLWEEYINTLLKDFFHHPMNKAHKNMHHLFQNGNGRIYPDFISKNHNNRIIADAKYKPIGNIGNSDYFQVLAYMMRFETKTGYYFYPEVYEAKNSLLWLNKGSKYEGKEEPGDEICLIKHGFKIPQNANDYKMFCSMMKESENIFIETLKQRICL